MYFYELCNKMQVNVFGVFMKITCFFFFVCSDAMLMDNDPDRLPDSRLIGGQFGAFCLRHLEFLHRASKHLSETVTFHSQTAAFILSANFLRSSRSGP